ncbi:MAG: hypothetical protein HY729_03545, partial [Candidatus Rokubacteria bacterium]|nr:hypothetical protein [Candidatus Rokubacteria bacterium]
MRVVAIVALLVAISSSSLAQVKAPPDFTMDKADSSPGQVTFSHDKHRAKVAKCST